jgi:hypothetical protein
MGLAGSCRGSVDVIVCVLGGGGLSRVQVGSFEGFLASLNNQGYLLKKGGKCYQLQTTDF